MAFVYLIGNRDIDGEFKIGSTKGKNAENRLKQLQTGNNGELYVYKQYETNHPFEIEGMMHRKHFLKRGNGEWFLLNDEEIASFNDDCEECEKIIESLSNNPFYKKKKNAKNA